MTGRIGLQLGAALHLGNHDQHDRPFNPGRDGPGGNRRPDKDGAPGLGALADDNGDRRPDRPNGPGRERGDREGDHRALGLDVGLRGGRGLELDAGAALGPGLGLGLRLALDLGRREDRLDRRPAADPEPGPTPLREAGQTAPNGRPGGAEPPAGTRPGVAAGVGDQDGHGERNLLDRPNVPKPNAIPQGPAARLPDANGTERAGVGPAPAPNPLENPTATAKTAAIGATIGLAAGTDANIVPADAALTIAAAAQARIAEPGPVTDRAAEARAAPPITVGHAAGAPLDTSIALSTTRAAPIQPAADVAHPRDVRDASSPAPDRAAWTALAPNSTTTSQATPVAGSVQQAGGAEPSVTAPQSAAPGVAAPAAAAPSVTAPAASGPAPASTASTPATGYAPVGGTIQQASAPGAALAPGSLGVASASGPAPVSSAPSAGAAASVAAGNGAPALGGVPLPLFNPFLARRLGRGPRSRMADRSARGNGFWAILRVFGWRRRRRDVALDDRPIQENDEAPPPSGTERRPRAAVPESRRGRDATAATG